jgi:hypothetical protein
MHELGREVAAHEARSHGKFVAGSLPEELRQKMSDAGKYYASHEARDEHGRFTGLPAGGGGGSAVPTGTSGSSGVDMHKVSHRRARAVCAWTLVHRCRLRRPDGHDGVRLLVFQNGRSATTSRAPSRATR